MVELLGWIANILFMLAASPQAYKSYKEGHSHGVSAGMLWIWCAGESLSIVYGVLVEVPLPILVNYVINLLFILVILKYKYYYTGGN